MKLVSLFAASVGLAFASCSEPAKGDSSGADSTKTAEKKGKVYCLSSARDTQSISKTHAEAHGLLPAAIYKVTDGVQANVIDGKNFLSTSANWEPGMLRPPL